MLLFPFIFLKLFLQVAHIVCSCDKLCFVVIELFSTAWWIIIITITNKVASRICKYSYDLHYKVLLGSRDNNAAAIYLTDMYDFCDVKPCPSLKNNNKQNLNLCYQFLVVIKKKLCFSFKHRKTMFMCLHWLFASFPFKYSFYLYTYIISCTWAHWQTEVWLFASLFFLF